MANILPVITLYQPWATWIMRGWKKIETRKHNKFGSLKNQTILIHAGLTTDSEAINNPYLTKEQLLYNPDEVINGFILGSAFVSDYKYLNQYHSKHALIDCESVHRWGLFLENIVIFENPIPEKGSVGIWNYDLQKRCKVKKQVDTPTLF